MRRNIIEFIAIKLTKGKLLHVDLRIYFQEYFYIIFHN